MVLGAQYPLTARVGTLSFCPSTAYGLGFDTFSGTVPISVIGQPTPSVQFRMERPDGNLRYHMCCPGIPSFDRVRT